MYELKISCLPKIDYQRLSIRKTTDYSKIKYYKLTHLSQKKY